MEMKIKLEIMPSAVYKPRRLVIEIKSPQDELFIRHFIQKMQNLEEVVAGLRLWPSSKARATAVSDHVPNADEEEFLERLMQAITSSEAK